MAYLVKVHPLVLLLFNGKTIFVVKIFNKVPKCVQSIDAESFDLGPHGMAVLQQEKIVNFRLTITQQQMEANADYQDLQLQPG